MDPVIKRVPKTSACRPHASNGAWRRARRIGAGVLALSAAWTASPPHQAQALTPPPQPRGKFGCIDKTGGFVIPAIYDHIDSCSGAIIAVHRGGLEGFFNDRGQAVLPVDIRSDSWSTMPPFAHGLEPVEENGHVGYIDEHGDLVIAANFLGAGRFGPNGHAHVLLEEPGSDVERALIDTSGHYVIAPRKDSFSDLGPNGLATVSSNGLHDFGYMDQSGLIRIPERFEHAGMFGSNGLAAVELDGKWGYIDSSGAFVIPPRYDDARDFGRRAPHGLAAVLLGGRQHFIDRHGRTIATLDPGMRVFADFSRGLAQAGPDREGVGFIDEHGRTVIPPKFDAESDFSTNGTAAVDVAGKWGFIDRRGRFVIQPQFDGARAFAPNGLASVPIGDKLGYIDRRGRIAIPPRFDSAESFAENGLALVEVDRPGGTSFRQHPRYRGSNGSRTLGLQRQRCCHRAIAGIIIAGPANVEGGGERRAGEDRRLLSGAQT